MEYVWLGFCVVAFPEPSPNCHCHDVGELIEVSVNCTNAGFVEDPFTDEKFAVGGIYAVSEVHVDGVGSVPLYLRNNIITIFANSKKNINRNKSFYVIMKKWLF